MLYILTAIRFLIGFVKIFACNQNECRKIDCLQSISEKAYVCLFLAYFSILNSHAINLASGITRSDGTNPDQYESDSFRQFLGPHSSKSSPKISARSPSAQHLQSLIDRSSYSLKSGQIDLAIDYLNKAMASARDSNNPHLLAHAENMLGYAYTIQGDLGRAEPILDKTLATAQKTGNHLIAASVLSNLGILYAARNDYAQAQKTFKRCIEIANEAGDDSISISASINLSMLSLKVSEYITAVESIESAAHRISTLPDTAGKARMLLSAGLIFQNLIGKAPGLTADNDLVNRAYRAYTEAERIAIESNDTYLSCFANAYIGQLYALESRYSEALHFIRKAAFIAQERNYNDINYHWQWQIARILNKQDRKTAAISAYRRAIRMHDKIRDDHIAQTRSISYDDNSKSLNYELAELLIRQTYDLVEGSDLQAYLQQAREIIESIKADELNAFLGDECALSGRKKIQEIDSVDDSTSVIYIVSFTDRLEILVSTAGQLSRVMVPVTKADFVSEVRSFRQRLEERTTNRYLEHAQTLYKWLIAPLKPYLTKLNIETLVFVPNESLRNVPLAALHDGHQFLVENYSIAISPGLTLMSPTSTNWDKSKILLCGLSLPVSGFSGLDYVSNEVTALSTLFDGRSLLDETFRYDRFEHEINNANYSIIHIASHGVMSADPRDSYLLTFDRKLRMNDLERLLKPYQFRGAPVELLTLSACETAAGTEKAALGFAGLALKAGARSVLGTLWSVNDAAASTLIQDFYTRFIVTSPPTKAKALQHAQITMLSDQRYRHPCYWSPFILVGNWL